MNSTLNSTLIFTLNCTLNSITNYAVHLTMNSAMNYTMNSTMILLQMLQLYFLAELPYTNSTVNYKIIIFIISIIVIS